MTTDKRSTPKLCPGSGLNAGRAGLKKLVAVCPSCERTVPIMYGNTLQNHGRTKGRGGRKRKPETGRRRK